MTDGMLDQTDFAADPPEGWKGAKERAQLAVYRAQRDAIDRDIPVAVAVCGWDWSGKSEVARFLGEKLDPNHVATHWFLPDPQAADRPLWQRYWLGLPAAGEVALLVRLWYQHVIDDRVHRRRTDAEADRLVEQIVAMERWLTDAGHVLVKVWLHVDADTQRRRAAERDDGRFPRWRGGGDQPSQADLYDTYRKVAEDVLARTDGEHAPWHVVPAVELRSAKLEVAGHVADAVAAAARRRNATIGQVAQAAAVRTPETTAADTLLPAGGLAGIDLTAKLAHGQYHEGLPDMQRRLADLQYACYERGRTFVLVMEGGDAAGKGGAIRRLTERLDPRYCHVHAIGKPHGADATHHYLWRFWRRLPDRGHWVVFDRSWYGRVLVERVENYARPDQWQRAYDEIVRFEAMVAADGAIVQKLWLQIDRDEQLRRFQSRQKVEYKRFKITDEDWRNRDKWDQHETAADDMVRRTHTADAPWAVIPANSKKFARFEVLRSCVERLEAALEG